MSDEDLTNGLTIDEICEKSFTWSMNVHPNELEGSPAEVALLVKLASDIPKLAKRLGVDPARIAFTLHTSLGKDVRVSWFPG